MKLLVIVLALSCVAYATAGMKYWPNAIRLPHRFRRESHPQGTTITNASPSGANDVPQASLDVNYNRRLFDNGRTSVNFREGAVVIPGFNPHPYGQLDITHRIGQSGFVNAYGGLEPGALAGLSRNYGIGGGFRFRREAGRDSAFKLRSSWENVDSSEVSHIFGGTRVVME